MEIQNSLALFVAGVQYALLLHCKEDFSLAKEKTEFIAKKTRRKTLSERDRKTECGAEQYMGLG